MNEPNPSRHERQISVSTALPAISAALLTLALYAITLNGTFIYDDVFIAREDPRLTQPKFWREYWTDQYFLGSVDRLYRPLTSMTYAIQAYTTGDLAWPFHLVNWLMAAGCSALVAEMGRRLAGLATAWVAGLLFAAHPIHVEAIAGIVGRAEVMCLLGTLSGILVYLGGPLTPRRIVAVLVCFIAALLSKEQGLLFPLLIGFLAVLQRHASARGIDSLQTKRGTILAMFMIYLAAGYLFFRESILPMAFDRNLIDWSVNPLVTSAGADRWLMVVTILGRYAGLLVWPNTLSVDYGGQVLGSSMRWNEPWIYIGIITLSLAILLLVSAMRRGDIPVAFCLLATGVLYGMVSNVTLIGTIMAERLMFIPSAFVAVLAGIGLTRLVIRNPSLRPIAVATVATLVVLGAIRTVTYAMRWNSASTFMQISLAEQPRSTQLLGIVHTENMKAGQWAEAKRIGETCLVLAPHYWRSYALLALAEVELGNFARARELMELAKVQAFHRFVEPARIEVELRIMDIEKDMPSTGPTTKESPPSSRTETK